MIELGKIVDRRQRVMELFAAALELSPEERRAFLDQECAGNHAVLSEIERLLAADEKAQEEEFMAAPALDGEAVQIAAERAEDALIGRVCGHYKILALIGEGGMGEVYLAEDMEVKRRVALKLIRGRIKTKDLLRRFHNERQILANLDHPHIARLFDGGATQDGVPFLVMEYVEGQTIIEYANAHRLSIAQRLNLFRKVCAAVEYAHQHLVIHRDIKPGNIIVKAEGVPKLLDFGIAKLESVDASTSRQLPTIAARIMTPEYASPEQARGERVTTATDIYSLGVVLYELLTGERPYQFKSSRAEEIARVICEERPERPSMRISRFEESRSADEASPRTQTAENVNATRNGSPARLRGDLDNITLMALRKDPQRRYSSVGQFSEDIRRHLEGLPVIARKDTFAYRAQKFVGRNKIGVASVALVLIALVGGIIATTWEAHLARIQRARAERRFDELRRLGSSSVFDLDGAINELPAATHARPLLIERAQRYLDNLAREAGDDPSLQREIASSYIKIGDPPAALTSYSKAAAMLEFLVARDKSDAKSRRDLGVAYMRLADAQSELARETCRTLRCKNHSLAPHSTPSAWRNRANQSY